jgi:ribosomal protein S18 acetylase RimI-like enzyme
MNPETTETATDARIEIESAKADALPYVLSTWGRGQEAHLPGIPQYGFLKAFAPQQARIIKASKVLCANRDGKIIGFVVYTPIIDTSHAELHWLFVRKEERGKRIGRELMRHSFGERRPTITTWTPDLRHVGLSDAPYTPFWLRFT